MQVLTKDNPETNEFRISGEAGVVIVGEGSAQILRKLGDSDYLPLTDGAGEEVIFYGNHENSVMFNSEVVNKLPGARFKIRVDTESAVRVHVEE